MNFVVSGELKGPLTNPWKSTGLNGFFVGIAQVTNGKKNKRGKGRQEMNDPWISIRREECYGNIEPDIFLLDHSDDILVARSAAVSYGTELKDEKHIRSMINNLKKRGHLTPFESVNYVFHISGISKACGAQMSRHRVGQGHVSSSRRFQTQGAAFVYPLLDYVESKEMASSIYSRMSDTNEAAMWTYSYLRNMGVPKQDARRVIPVCSAQERIWFVNARALIDFFRLRLAPDAEWEIRRLASLVQRIVKEVSPRIFGNTESQQEKIIETSN